MKVVPRVLAKECNTIHRKEEMEDEGAKERRKVEDFPKKIRPFGPSNPEHIYTHLKSKIGSDEPCRESPRLTPEAR